MSNKYKTGDDVPTKVLAYRLEELSDCITKSDLSQFVMRVPAELDHCPDLVMSIAADRLVSLEAQLKEREWISVGKHGWPKVNGLYVIDLRDFSPVVDEFKDGEFVDYPFEEIIQYMPLPSPPKEQG